MRNTRPVKGDEGRAEPVTQGNEEGRGMKPSRVRLALALLFALGVVAAVAAFASSSSTSLARHGAQLVDKRTGDPDAIGASSAESTIGQPEEARSGDMTGAAEDYANRAYPSDVVPFELTQAAVNSWTAAVASSQGKGKNNVGGQMGKKGKGKK